MAKWEKAYNRTYESEHKDIQSQAYNNGWSACLKFVKPLVDTGLWIRSRKFEWLKGGRANEALIEKRNQASHCGIAVTDALMFEKGCWLAREDKSVFLEMYGVERDFCCALRDVEQFCKMFDWHGGMNNFYENRNMKETTFYKTWLSMIVAIKEIPAGNDNLANIRKYFEGNKVKYQLLEKEYGIELKRHNESRR